MTDVLVISIVECLEMLDLGEGIGFMRDQVQAVIIFKSYLVVIFNFVKFQ